MTNRLIKELTKLAAFVFECEPEMLNHPTRAMNVVKARLSVYSFLINNSSYEYDSIYSIYNQSESNGKQLIRGLKTRLINDQEFKRKYELFIALAKVYKDFY